jgi:IclR family acetate operon transcriptional repressor
MEPTGVEIRSVSKALRLLEALGREQDPAGVSDLARQLDMDKSSVSRMLRTLEQAGFVAQDPVTQRYALGITLGILGQKALRRIDLRDSARSTLERMAERTGECSHMAILADNRAFYIDQAAPGRGVLVDAPVGTLAPLYCTALGKALLAFQPARVREAIVGGLAFEPFTRRTIRDVAGLASALEEVRRNGVAFDDEEYSVGVRCIAAPVFRHDGSVCAAVGVSGPSPRVTDDRLREWEVFVRDEAAALSRRLGFDGADEPARMAAPG